MSSIIAKLSNISRGASIVLWKIVQTLLPNMDSSVAIAAVGGSILTILLAVTGWHYYCRVQCPKMNLKGAKVLITGGSQGIGFSVAKSCIAQGAHVAILARNKEKLSRAAEALRKIDSSCDVLTISACVTSYEAMEREIALELKEAGWNELDAVVCNAGVESVGCVESTPIEEFQRIMNINYFGMVNTVKITLPYLKRSKTPTKVGRLLVVSSLLGLMGMTYYSAYSASKWAVRGFVESVTADLAAKNIFVSIVYPPDVKTPQLEREKAAPIPQSVKDLSAQADVFEPDDVGKDIMKMLEKGCYHRSWGLDGWMLMNLTAGFGITHSLMDTFTGIFGMGLFRGIAMWYIQDMYRVCKSSLCSEIVDEHYKAAAKIGTERAERKE